MHHPPEQARAEPASALGVLERAGIAVWGFQRLRDVWPLVVLPYVIGLAIATRRYR